MNASRALGVDDRRQHFSRRGDVQDGLSIIGGQRRRR